MNFSISSSDRDPGAVDSGMEGYKIGWDTMTPIEEKRKFVMQHALRRHPTDRMEKQVLAQSDAWMDRMFNSLKDKCCRCNTNKACHNYLDPNSERGERLCCKCHIARGGTPADWHPDCMQVVEEQTHAAA